MTRPRAAPMPQPRMRADELKILRFLAILISPRSILWAAEAANETIANARFTESAGRETSRTPPGFRATLSRTGEYAAAGAYRLRRRATISCRFRAAARQLRAASFR